MKNIVFVLGFSLIALGLLAQHPGGGKGKGYEYFKKATIGVIRGEVVDANSGKPIEFANISLYNRADSLVGGTITDNTGSFSLEKLHFGRYTLKIDFIGYKSEKITDVKVTPRQSTVFVGKIKYHPTTENLDAITIKEKRPVVEYKLDKQVIHVDEDVTSVGGNAVDVLKNSPSVQVDMDDNVSIRGSSNITILIDGKRSAFTSSSDALQQIPANTIKNIEIITNPSAKYDPDGLAGIINIVTKQGLRKGLNLTVTLNVGTSNQYDGGIDVNRRFKKINVLASYHFRNSERHFQGKTSQTNYYNNGDSSVSIFQLGDKVRGRQTHSIGAGVDYDLNASTSVSLSGKYRITKRASGGLTNYWQYSDIDTFQVYTINNVDESNGQSYDVSLDFQKKFSQEGRKLTANAVYSQSLSHPSQTMDYVYYWFDAMESDSLFYQRNYSDDAGVTASGQVDYEQPVGEKGKFEAGAKYTDMSSDDDYTFQNKYTDSWVIDLNQSNRFLYREQVGAGYVMFSNAFAGFEYQLGLRLEQANRIANQVSYNTQFDTAYFQYYPTMHISRKIGKKNEVQLSYSRRVNRPRGRMLNPYRDYSNPLFIRQGNVKLMPEYVDSYELNYQRRISKGFLSTSLYYRQVNGAFTRIRKMLDDGHMLMTFVNMSNEKNLGLELMGNFRFLPWWNLNASVSFYQFSIDASNLSDITTGATSSFNQSARINSSFMLPWHLTLQMMMFYRSPSITAQGERDSMGWGSFGLRKSTADKKWTFSFRYNDPFHMMHFHFKTQTNNFVSDSEFRRLSTMITVGVVYRFITQPEKRKRPNYNNRDNSGNMLDNMF